MLHNCKLIATCQLKKGVNVNLDIGITVDTFPAKFDREGVGDGRFHDWIPEGEAKQFQGLDE